MEAEPDLYSILLCPVLVYKLLFDLQLLINCKISRSDSELDSLMEVIEAEVFVTERIGVNPSHLLTHRNEFKPLHIASLLVSGGMSGVNAPCCYGNQPHLPSNCTVVLQIEARKQALHHCR